MRNEKRQRVMEQVEQGIGLVFTVFLTAVVAMVVTLYLTSL